MLGLEALPSAGETSPVPDGDHDELADQLLGAGVSFQESARRPAESRAVKRAMANGLHVRQGGHQITELLDLPEVAPPRSGETPLARSPHRLMQAIADDS